MQSDQYLHQSLADYRQLLLQASCDVPSLSVYCRIRKIRYLQFSRWLRSEGIDPDQLVPVKQQIPPAIIHPISFTDAAAPSSDSVRFADSTIRNVKLRLSGKINLSIGEITPESLLHILSGLSGSTLSSQACSH